MLTLYYSPGACSLAVHIALAEANQEYTLKKVDLKTKEISGGGDFWKVNPKGYVPVIEMEDGSTLTEAAAILFYIAEKSKALPVSDDSFARYRLQEALTFVSSELHKGVGAFFNQALTGEYRDEVVKKVKKRLDYLQDLISKQGFVAGDAYTVADSYCFTILRWLKYIDTGINMNEYPKLDHYWNEILARPAVQRAYAEEELKR